MFFEYALPGLDLSMRHEPIKNDRNKTGNKLTDSLGRSPLILRVRDDWLVIIDSRPTLRESCPVLRERNEETYKH